MNTVWKVLTRKKILDPVSAEQTELGRVLNTLDLTALGVGSTLGVGVYVLAGQVAKETAGPSVILSFAIAALASVFAGLCYAEFGARTPRAGSAYIYSYVCVGEFVAFVIGWNLILEYIIGSASVARGLSLYLDTLINDTLKDTFERIAPIDVSFMSQYFDFLAFGISVILAGALAFGMKESSSVNKIITLLNVAVVVFVVVGGFVKGNWDNLHPELPANRTDAGSGGFFPYGIEGMIKGAATCFYGFVGFDCIATTGEEVKNPKRAIPIAIVVSLFVIFLAYFGSSLAVVLMVPYFDQDPNAPLPYAFHTVGWEAAKWVVAIGAIFGLCASLFGAMFPLPRILYAMASDSLVFRFLGRVNARFKTPVVGTLLAGLLTGLMAALFDLKQLVNMMSIGTLLAYTIVAASVLLLRYTENRGMDVGSSEETELMATSEEPLSVWKQIFNVGRQYPTDVSEKIVKIAICIYCILCLLIGLCAMYLKDYILDKEIWAIVLTAVVVCVTVLIVMSIATQPQSRKELTFKVPFVPLVPALSILVNIYLMLMLDTNTWIRFAVWMALGIPTYYFSVQSHSDARNESISSKTVVANGKMNGFSNHAFNNTDEIHIVEETPKKNAAPRPTLAKIESTIAALDEILENEEATIYDRKYSVDSLSTASNVLYEENVRADVHCADCSDGPATPVKVVDAPPLLKSGDVSSSPALDPPSGAIAQSQNSELPLDEKTDLSADAGDLAPALDPPSGAITENQNGELPLEEKTDHSADITSTLDPPSSAIIQNQNSELPLEEKTDLLVDEQPVENDKLSVQENTEPPTIVENDVHKLDAGTDPPTGTTVQIEDPVVEDVIPAPPPLVPGSSVNIPRAQFGASAFRDVKLRPVVKTSSPAVSRENSELPEGEQRQSNDNIKFGSPEHKEFLDKLSQTLQEGYMPTQVIVNFSKLPSVKKAPPNPQLPNEDVIEDSINQDEAKEKLAEFLARTASFVPGPVTSAEEKPEKKYAVVKENDIKDSREQHRRNMQDIFGSIRLRKEDSFSAVDSSVKPNDRVGDDRPTEEEAKDGAAGDHLRHKENMNDIFKTIRLRKVNSLES